MKDYYSILGVSRSASEAEIKKAYRKKLRELHPDLADNNANDEEAVKEVNDAFEVLGHADKRDLYDRGVDPLAQNSAGPGFGGFGGFGSDMFSDLFDMFGGGFSASSSPRRGRSRKTRGQDILVQANVDLNTAIFGGTVNLQFQTLAKCQKCTGSGSTSGGGETTCKQCSGQGVVQHVSRTMFGQMVSQTECPACNGFGSKISDPCSDCDSLGVIRQTRNFDTELPAGCANGRRLKIENEGASGTNGGQCGDLFIEVSVKPDDTFEIQDHDLVCKITIPVTTALLGSSVIVHTFDGEQKITIEPGTNSGSTIILKNLGLPKFVGSLENRGNLKVFCEVKLPQKVSSKAKNIIEELAAELKDDKTTVKLESIHSGGFMSWLKNLMH